MIAACVVGTVLYSAGSISWYGVMIIFFVTSTGWSNYKRHLKQDSEKTYEKSGRRDAGQVAANGGLAVLLCLANEGYPSEIWWLFFIGLMATVTADTWATEIGSLSRTMPRSIVSGKRVPKGVSGGVTGLGLLAAVFGAMMIGGCGIAFSHIDHFEVHALWLFMAATWGGLCGAVIDSWLGALWQRMNRCRECGKELEGSIHCGQSTYYERGYRWLNNDAVNVISSFMGGIITLMLYRIGEGLY